MHSLAHITQKTSMRSAKICEDVYKTSHSPQSFAEYISTGCFADFFRDYADLNKVLQTYVQVCRPLEFQNSMEVANLSGGLSAFAVIVFTDR